MSAAGKEFFVMNDAPASLLSHVSRTLNFSAAARELYCTSPP